MSTEVQGESQEDELTDMETTAASDSAPEESTHLLSTQEPEAQRLSSVQSQNSHSTTTCIMQPGRHRTSVDIMEQSTQSDRPSTPANCDSISTSMETGPTINVERSSEMADLLVASEEATVKSAELESPVPVNVVEERSILASTPSSQIDVTNGANSTAPSTGLRVPQSAEVVSGTFEQRTRDSEQTLEHSEKPSLSPSTVVCTTATMSTVVCTTATVSTVVCTTATVSAAAGATSAPAEGDVNSQGGQAEMETGTTYDYTLGPEPKVLCGSWKEFDDTNYLRGCKWSPDGTCLLTCSDDNKMRLYNLPTELYSGIVDTLPEISPVLMVPQGDSVYDFAWYPKMNSWEADTCCFVTSCKDHPVHLWDAFYLHKRASYVAYNHLDEVVAPHSLAFSLDGEKLYSGFHKSIKVFSVSRPGRECTTRSTYEKKVGGQPGIVSSIVMHPFHRNTYALGTYSCSVGLYCENTRGATIILEGVGSGVTHMLFSPDGNSLYVGLRKNDLIECWDLRNPGKVLHCLKRQVDTNQRIYFDLSHNKRYLLSGSTSGHIYGWDITMETDVTEDNFLKPLLSFQGSCDAVNGCSIHPTLPLLAASSGQRKFSLPSGGSASSDSDEDEDAVENSVKLWSLLGHRTGSYEDIMGLCELSRGNT